MFQFNLFHSSILQSSSIYTSSCIYSYIQYILPYVSPCIYLYPYLPLSSIQVNHLSISISINLLLGGVRESNNNINLFSCHTLMNSLFQIFSHQIPATQSSGVNGPNCRSSFPKRPGRIHDVPIIWRLKAYSSMY